MAVLTENEIRRLTKRNKNGNVKEITIIKGDIITPSAKSYISENNIEIKYQDDREKKETSEVKIQVTEQEIASKEADSQINQSTESNAKYTTLFGAKLYDKPEYMTHLRGNVLVFKDHPIIALRGKIDSLESSLLEFQVITAKNNKTKLVNDLEEIISFIRLLMRCEVSGEPVAEYTLQGLDKNELREQSHNPKKYFGIGHFLPNYTMGETVMYLNKLRTHARETELAAFNAFKGQYGEVQREDIIQALNRLSSLFWIMMFKEMTGQYDIGKD